MLVGGLGVRITLVLMRDTSIYAKAAEFEQAEKFREARQTMAVLWGKNLGILIPDVSAAGNSFDVSKFHSGGQ